MTTTFAHPPRQTGRLWAAAIFLLCSALYFLTRSPALDEWDSVQFALGAERGFNLFRHQPHPPGYPLYVGFGWLGRALGMKTRAALQLGSALGGGLFVAGWFALAARAGGRRLAGWTALGLAALPITWMTATKALTDAPATGFLALELLAAAVFRENGKRAPLAGAALAGALAAGVRPQNVGIAALILILALAMPLAPGRRWALGLGGFAAGCLLWLLPTMALQAGCPEAGGSWLAYPRLLWSQWEWRLDQPKAFVGATGQTAERLAERLWLHFAGWFTRGFAFSEIPWLGAVGFGLLAGGWVLAWRRGAVPRAFWREHGPWAAAYVGMIFTCLPPDQRYYLPIFPLLLLPALAGWGSLRGPPGRGMVAALPAVLFALALPLARENHAEAAPPVRLVRQVESLFPLLEQRREVWLVLRDSRRHAEWYAPEFRTEWSQRFPPPARWPADWTRARAVFTDDLETVAAGPPAPGWAWREVAEFHRSPLIYRKHNAVTLWRLDSASTRIPERP